jgi:hypothetical protein
MTSVRKISEWEWELYKDNIKTCYLTRNMTREQVMTHMEEEYGFRARYSRRFRL